MHRQSPGRNLRSKGIRVKHVLQICLLLVVCFWLMYQLKHSHDKKKEFDESGKKISLVRESSDTLIKFGRKDIRPLPEERMNMNEKHDGAEEEDEETTGEDMDENKDEDEPEDKKVEVKEDEEMDSGDDETDESGKEKLDVEVDRGDFIDEKDGDGDEDENEEKDTEDGNDQMEKRNSVDETDHDGDDATAHEAREELYRADDASSAVTHDTETGGVESENEHEENPNKQHENILEQELKENNSDETDKREKGQELEVGGEIDRDGKQLDARNSETDENMVDSSHDNVSLNETVTEGLNPETRNNITVLTIGDENLSLSNLTENESQTDHDQKILIEDPLVDGLNLQATDNSTLNMDDNQFGSNSTSSDNAKDSKTEEFSGTSNDTESRESNDASETDKSDTKDNSDEILESENNEHPEEIQQDSIDLSDSSNPLEEKVVRMDLDTLPEIQTEGTISEDAAAE